MCVLRPRRGGKVARSLFLEFVCFDLVVVGQVTGSFFMESMCCLLVVEGQVAGSFFIELLCFDPVEGQVTGRFP